MVEVNFIPGYSLLLSYWNRLCYTRIPTGLWKGLVMTSGLHTSGQCTDSEQV